MFSCFEKGFWLRLCQSRVVLGVEMLSPLENQAAVRYSSNSSKSELCFNFFNAFSLPKFDVL
jgi:hypothetical protein